MLFCDLIQVAYDVATVAAELATDLATGELFAVDPSQQAQNSYNRVWRDITSFTRGEIGKPALTTALSRHLHIMETRCGTPREWALGHGLYIDGATALEFVERPENSDLYAALLGERPIGRSMSTNSIEGLRPRRSTQPDSGIRRTI